VKKTLFILLLLSACVEPEKPPAYLLSKEQMINILTDIHIAEAKVNMMNLRSYDSMQVLYRKLEGDIFKKYQVDTAVYNKSYQYYLENTKEMDEIYAALVDSLTLRENLGKID
jgi:hypothetical protein